MNECVVVRKSLDVNLNLFRGTRRDSGPNLWSGRTLRSFLQSAAVCVCVFTVLLCCVVPIVLTFVGSVGCKYTTLEWLFVRLHFSLTSTRPRRRQKG